MELELNKPVAMASDTKAELFNSKSDISFIIKTLEDGEYVLISDLYSDGLYLLKALHTHLNKKLSNTSFVEQRQYRNAYRKLSNHILMEIVDWKLLVKKAPAIGWLEKLYPEQGAFMLSFPQIQGMNSAWQWYVNGIAIPVLRNKVHPYYGTYFPTRFEHLVLFDQWLKRYQGPKKTAIDIGCGSGVLSLQMIEKGFQKVFATDTNPNAIWGLKESMGDTKLSRKIELDLGHLFGKWDKASELIVFNPPWLPKDEKKGRVDEAMYYNKTLFPEFFAEAQRRLLPDGKLVLLFSNLAQIAKVTNEHPIEKELAEGGRFLLERFFKKNVKADSDNTKRDAHWRANEKVELWVLVHK